MTPEFYRGVTVACLAAAFVVLMFSRWGEGPGSPSQYAPRAVWVALGLCLVSFAAAIAFRVLS